MKKRYYSDKYIIRQIAIIDEIHERTQNEWVDANSLYRECEEKPWLAKDLKELLKHRSDLSYIKGFWMGYTLRGGMKDED